MISTHRRDAAGVGSAGKGSDLMNGLFQGALFVAFLVAIAAGVVPLPLS
ncbi:MAG TPA: hypothetical protein VHS99_09390 [Chloroflexota bacterium]|nr:hypothetical protein [Chloroflexota bacterium]